VSLLGPSDREIQQAEERVTAQKTLVQRMIARGTPTQGAEDQLRQLERTLARIKERYRTSRTANFQRKIGERSREAFPQPSLAPAGIVRASEI
jgi:hypothetical protein